jgi:hypothetical protein
MAQTAHGSGNTGAGSSHLPGDQVTAALQADTQPQQQQQQQQQPPLRASTSIADMTSSGSSSSGDDPDTAAPASSSNKKPSKQQRLFDALDGASLALTTASLGLSAALCALCLNNSNLAWAGVLLLGFIVAAPVVVGALILARNHWLVVALRYCLSVAALQRDSGLGFTNVRSRVLRLVLSGLSSCLLSMVGLVVALYLTACYVVSAAVVWCCTVYLSHVSVKGCSAHYCYVLLLATAVCIFSGLANVIPMRKMRFTCDSSPGDSYESRIPSTTHACSACFAL